MKTCMSENYAKFIKGGTCRMETPKAKAPKLMNHVCTLFKTSL